MKTEQIAKIVHQANKAYCETQGDDSQFNWELAPEWQKSGAVAGVESLIEDPELTPEQLHEDWLNHKKEEGWKYGPIKDSNKKEHPCCVPYKDLPPSQKVKDDLFTAIVGALL